MVENKNRGEIPVVSGIFTLIELLVVVAMIAIVFTSKSLNFLLISAYGGIGPFLCPYV